MSTMISADQPFHSYVPIRNDPGIESAITAMAEAVKGFAQTQIAAPNTSSSHASGAGETATASHLEDAVKDLLEALQSGDGGVSPEQGVQQQLGQLQQPGQSSVASGGQGAIVSHLEDAVQDLLAALQSRDGGTTPEQAVQQQLAQLQQGSQTGAGGNLAADYNNVLGQVAADGNSAQNVQNAVRQFLKDADATSDDSTQALKSAMTNILNSLQDGTYSQQGSEAALQGAASRDGLSGVTSVSVAGPAGDAAQAAGVFDGGTNAKGSLGANTAILESEVANGGSNGSSQITNNANALANEADHAASDAAGRGDTASANEDRALATAARNIANSAKVGGDGTYSAQASLAALKQALPDRSNDLVA